MKKYLTILLLSLGILSCEDDSIIPQPAISFYPKLAASSTEGDGVVHVISLETTGRLDSDASVTIRVSNGDFLEISPAPSGGKIQLNLAAGETLASFTAKALKDAIPFNYTAVFEIESVGGALEGIGASRFELQVKSLDQECPAAEEIERTDLADARGLAGQTVTLVGRVNSTDYGFSSGQFFFQDETGGINVFHSGQVGIVSPGNVIKVVGQIGEFAGQVQVEPNSLEVICETEGAPAAIEISSSDLTLNSQYQGMRVLIKDVSLNTSGWPSTPIGSGSGTSVSASSGGVSFTVRIDRGESYYDGSPVPSSTVDLTGTLGRFNDEIQIMPFFEGDVVNAGSGGGGGGGGGGTFTLPFTDDFEDCTDDFATPANWIEEFAAGSKTDRGWGCRQEGVNNSRAVRASAFGGAAGEDDAWLITAKKVDLSGKSTAYLQFDMKSEFPGPGTIQVYWSEDYGGSGSPSGGTWNELTDVASQLPAAGSGSFVTVTSDLAAATGKQVYVAFRYSGANNSDAADFAMDDLSITETDPGTGGGGGGGGSEVDIATARGMMNQTVIITGIVTTPDYGFNNGQFFVQDGTAGINVYWAGNFGQVAAGDEVTITGGISEFSSQLQITPSSLTVNSNGNNLPIAQTITSETMTLDSDLQGSYVEVTGVTLSDTGQWPTTSITSGSGVSVDATAHGVNFEIRIDRGESFYDGSSVPSQPFTLKGILSRFNDTVQIMPFFDGDIN